MTKTIRCRRSGVARARRARRISRRRSRCWRSISSTRWRTQPGQPQLLQQHRVLSLLSAVIEEVEQQALRDLLAGKRVFDRLGIYEARGFIRTGGSSRARAAGSSHAADYLAFLEVFDPKHPFLGDRVKALDRCRRDEVGPELPRAIRRPRHPRPSITPAGWQRAPQRHSEFAHGKGPNGQPIEAVIHSHAYPWSRPASARFTQ